MTMKYYLGLLIISCQLVLCNTSAFGATAVSKGIVKQNTHKMQKQIFIDIAKYSKEHKNNSKDNELEEKSWEKWLPLGLGLVGLGLVFIPYLSLIGLLAGVLALISGLLLRKKYPKTARWGIWLGGFCVVAFLSVLGLILFF